MSSSPTSGTTTESQTGLQTWTLDPVHSFAEFSVKHMVVATAKGRFGKLEGTLQWDGQHAETASVTATVDIASITTGEEGRDTHLRSEDFFHAEKHPTATFHSTRVETRGDDEFKVIGELTLRGVSREVTLDTEYEGTIKDPYGLNRAGFSAETTINRKDYGLNWNALLETGGAVVSDKVKVHLNLEFTRPD